MNWFKRAQVNKKLLKNLEKKKQVSLQKGWTPEEINWATNLSIKLGTPSYFLWLLNQTRNGSANIKTREDDRKIFEVLHKFEELKSKKLITEDINQYPSFSDLFNLVNRFQTEKSKETEKELSEIKGARLLYSQDNVSVIKVTGSEAGETLFEDSGWCVKHPNEFENYGMPFLLFRIYNKNYALYHPATGNFKNRNDQRMDLNDTVKLLEAIKYLYRNRLIDPYGEAEIMLEVMEKTHEINDLCKNNDLTQLKAKLSDNLAYAHLINKFYLSPEVVQTIKNQFYKKYINLHSFDKIIEFFNSIPNYLVIDFPITENIRDIIFSELRVYPVSFNKLPSFFKNNPDVLKFRKLGWIERIKQNPKSYANDLFPSDLKNDPDILQTLKTKWIKIIKEYPTEYNDPTTFPSYLRNDPDILESRRIGWIEWILREPLAYSFPDFPEELKDDPDILQARKSAWIKALKEDPILFIYSNFPDEMRNDPDIVEALKIGWIHFSKLISSLSYLSRIYNSYGFPDKLKNDPDILNIFKTIAITQLNRSWCNDLHSLPEILKNDPDILRALGKKLRKQAQQNITWLYHNTKREYLDDIKKHGLTAGAFSDRPIDFGGDIWLAINIKDLPQAEQTDSHPYGNVISYEPSYIQKNEWGEELQDNEGFPLEISIPPSKIFIANKKGKIIKPLLGL